MTTFDIWRGPDSEFGDRVPITEGYAYITDKGNFYVDIAADKRVQINAGSAVKLDDGVTQLEISEILTDKDIIPVSAGGTGLTTLTLNGILVGNGTNSVKLIPTKSGALYAEGPNAEPKFGALPIAQGGTNGTTAAQARTNLDVYSKGEVDNKVGEGVSKAYSTTLTVADWVASENMFYQDWNDVTLTCGKDGDVPPTIIPTSNREEYFKLDADKTEAIPSQGIRFWIAEKPANAIGLTIVDNR